jgi:SOS response regulatory protein OraA/RecX
LREEVREEIAKNMLRKGFSYEQIAELSGLKIKKNKRLSSGI